ncbi:MAG TPA: TM2 domain-containing protein, partial [Caldimonas sp.]
ASPAAQLDPTALSRHPRRRIGGVVYFAVDGSAHAVPVKRWPIQWLDIFTMGVRPSAGPLRRAWHQVFAQLGLGVGEGSRSRAIAVGLAMVFGWAGAHWFYLGRPRRGVVYLLTLPLLMAPLFLGLVDAFRFLWVDRAGFDARFSVLRSSEARA